MKECIIIPARYESTRFPGKPLALINGVPMVLRVWEKCIQVFDKKDVFIATDDNRIVDKCLSWCKDIRMVKTSPYCRTGTDRVCHAYNFLEEAGHEYYWVINVQGDEPLIRAIDINSIRNSYLKNNDPMVAHCGYCSGLPFEYTDRNVIKIVKDIFGNLIYASRAPIPHSKDGTTLGFLKQVCIYAYTPELLRSFETIESTVLEAREDIEILRFIEARNRVRMVRVSNSSISVDVPEDIKRVEERLNGQEKFREPSIGRD